MDRYSSHDHSFRDHASRDEISGDITYFPPLVTPYRLREREDAFGAAIAGAAGEGDAYRGGGSLFHVGRFETIEFALVLEPEQPLRIARKIFYAGMNALADALGVLSPPEKPIGFRYPGSLWFDGALVGGGRLAAPPLCSEDETPAWLVFGAMVRAGGMRETDGAMAPDITTLDDEGFDAWSAPEFSACFARHFLVELDSWAERGMAGIAARYLARLEKKPGETRRGISEDGDLLLHAAGGEAALRVNFRDALARPDWLDAEQNEVRG